MLRTKKLTIKDNVYDVKYPNTGQQIDIELLKQQFVNGRYDELRFSTNPIMQAAADKIDMIATFTILIPALKEDVNAKSLFDLEEEASDELLVVYAEQFIPWYVEIKESIKNPKKAIDTSKDNREGVASEKI